MSKKDNKPGHWYNLHFKDMGGSLKGVTKYDTTFLEELDIKSIKNTDLQIATITEFAQQKKLPYRIVVSGRGLKEVQVIYDPKIVK